jgi:hypothetical protein
VCSNAPELIALSYKVGVMGSLVNEGGNVGGNIMDPRTDKTQWGGMGHAMKHDAGHPLGK